MRRPWRVTVPPCLARTGGAIGSWVSSTGDRVRAYDASVRTGTCLIVVALLVAACGGVPASSPTVHPTTASETAGSPTPTVTTPTGSAIVPTPTTQPPGGFTLTSSAFADGGDIPSRFTCDGKDVSPPLAWSGEPGGTVAYLLTMRDPDANDFLHWIAWNVPADVDHLEADASGKMPSGAGEGRADFGGGRVGYRGPCPPSGTHDYVLTLYALPIMLADATATPPDRLERAAAKIALGTATLRGTYRRH